MKNEIQQTLYLPTFTHWRRVGINSIQRVSIIVSIILLFSLKGEAQDFSSPEDPYIEITEVEGVLKICGVAFGANSENNHKAVVLDIACPKENPQLIKNVTEELFGKSSDDIQKACKDYLSDVQIGKKKVEIKGSVLKIFCNCLCYQKGRIFSCLIGHNVFGKDAINNLTQTKGRGYIYDITKESCLSLEDVFDNKWLEKQAKKIRRGGNVFLSSPNNELLIFVTPRYTSQMDIFNLFKHPYVAKKIKEHLNPKFVELIDWDNPPLLLYEAQIDFPQIIKDVEMMNK